MAKQKECSAEADDRQLVALTLQDNSCFKCLMERYEPKLKRYIGRLGRFSVEETEDLLQEIFIKTYRNLSGFNADLSFSAWIYRIAHNHVVSHFRKKTARPQTVELLAEDSGLLADSLELSDELDAALLAEKIKLTLSRLKPEYNEILTLKFLEDKSYDELADILRKPPGTIATMIHKAKKDFKQYWDYERIN